MANSFSIEDISGTVAYLKALNKDAAEHPVTRLAEYLHAEYCAKNYGSCTKSIACGDGWVPKAEHLLLALPRIFPKTVVGAPKKSKTVKRKIQLDDDK